MCSCQFKGLVTVEVCLPISSHVTMLLGSFAIMLLLTFNGHSKTHTQISGEKISSKTIWKMSEMSSKFLSRLLLICHLIGP